MDRQKFINVLCVGDCKVGKSTILRRVCNDFNADPHRYFPTIGLETLHFKTISKNTKVSLNIWDVSGNPRFRTVAHGFLRRSSVVCIFFDTSNVESFKNIDTWKNWITNTSSREIKYFLIGVKKKNRIYSYKNGKEYADENDMEYVEMCGFQLANSIMAMNTIVHKCMEDDNVDISEHAVLSRNSESYTGCPCM